MAYVRIKQHEVRCPECGLMVCKASGTNSEIEVKCRKCQTVYVWSTDQPDRVQVKHPA
jgi:phage FluMu protein Com